MTRTWSMAVLAGLLLSGCFDVPKDPEHTLERVQQEEQFRAAIVAGVDVAAARTLIDRVETAVGARAQLKQGPGEVLLSQLEHGELDLVVGQFAKKSPWAGTVSLSAPPGGWEPAEEPALRAALRNGENAWIMAVERAVREK